MTITQVPSQCSVIGGEAFSKQVKPFTIQYRKVWLSQPGYGGALVSRYSWTCYWQRCCDLDLLICPGRGDWTMCESKCGSVFPNERLDPTQQHNNYTCGQESGQWSSVIMSNGEDGKKAKWDCYYCIQSMWKISHWFTITFPVQNHLIGNKAGWLYFCSFVLYAWLLMSASETTVMSVQRTVSFQFGQRILATSWLFFCGLDSIRHFRSDDRLCNRLDEGQQARSKNSLVEKGFRKKKKPIRHMVRRNILNVKLKE